MEDKKPSMRAMLPFIEFCTPPQLTKILRLCCALCQHDTTVRDTLSDERFRYSWDSYFVCNRMLLALLLPALLETAPRLRVLRALGRSLRPEEQLLELYEEEQEEKKQLEEF